jgi:hypothetical protein
VPEGVAGRSGGQGPGGAVLAAILAGGGVLLILVVGVVGLAGYFLVRDRLGHHPSATPSPAAAAPLPTGASGPSATTFPSPPSGWLTQQSTRYGYAYAVPPTWKVRDPDTSVGFENRAHQLTLMTAPADYRAGFCPATPSATRATAGFAAGSTSSLGSLATDSAEAWATAAYQPDQGGSPPTVTYTRPAQVTVGGLQAAAVTATVTVHAKGACNPPTAAVYALALPARPGPGGQDEPSTFIVVADQGVADAAAPPDLRAIVGSVRPTR